MTANQWNKLTYLYVNDVPLIYLLGFSVSIWHNNCEIRCYGYDDNKIKEVVNKVINCRFDIK